MSLGGGLPRGPKHFDCDAKAEAAKHGEDWVAGDQSGSYSIDDIDSTEKRTRHSRSGRGL